MCFVRLTNVRRGDTIWIILHGGISYECMHLQYVYMFFQLRVCSWCFCTLIRICGHGNYAVSTAILSV